MNKDENQVSENELNEQDELKEIMELQAKLQEKMEKFNKLDILDKLGVLQHEVCKGLYARIVSDQATAAEFSSAVNLLKNNNITVSQNTDDELQKLEEALNQRRSKRKPSKLDEAELKEDINNNIVTFKRIGE